MWAGYCFQISGPLHCQKAEGVVLAIKWIKIWVQFTPLKLGGGSLHLTFCQLPGENFYPHFPLPQWDFGLLTVPRLAHCHGDGRLVPGR